jgi:hypothetical protein
MYEREWAELGKIDYLLEQLARAVERGEVPFASYEALAPRYLERRAEIAEVLERVATRTPPQSAPSVVQHVSSGEPPLPVPPAGTPEPFRQSGPPPIPAPRVSQPSLPAQRVREPVSWTTVLIATGAFLVIVAAAVFAIAAWQLVSPALRFLFLGALTLGFYSAGERVRTKMGIATGGIALTVVASAMLLFDGWILIDGYKMTGPLPFALWLLVCSAVYWFTEVRLQSGFFGITGAAAQVGWWWLLGEGLGASSEIRLAGIAIVMAAWALTSRSVDEESPFFSLARILRMAAPIGAALVVFGFLAGFDSVAGPGTSAGLAEFFAAAVIGVSITAIVDSLGHNPSFGAIGHLPVVLVATTNRLDAWWQLGFFAVLAAAYITYELRRGGVGHGVFGLLSMLAATVTLGGLFDWSNNTIAAALVSLALVWTFAGWQLAQVSIPEEFKAKRVAVAALIAEFGAWMLLAALAVFLPVITQAFPAFGEAATYSDAALSVFLTVAVLIALVLHKRPAVPAAFLLSEYALWTLLSASQLAAGAPLRAVALITLAGAWSLGAGTIERFLEFDRHLMRGLMRVFVPFVLIIALMMDGWYAELPSWQSAALLAAVAAWFLLDGVLARIPQSLAVAGASATGAAAMWAGWNVDGATAAVWGSATALVVSGAGAVARRVRGAGDWAPWAAVATAATLAVFAWGDEAMLSAAFALPAVAAIIAVYSSRWFEGVFVAGALAAAATLALLAHLSVLPWTTVGVLAVLAAVQLAPAFFVGGAADSASGRVVRALAVSGLIPLLMLIVFGFWSSLTWIAVPGWIALDAHALAVSVVALGAYVLAAATAFDIDPGIYIGVGLFLVAYWIELAEGTVTGIEWYSTPAGVYVAWCGYRWSWKSPGKPVPLVTDLGAVALVLVPPALAMLDPYASQATSWSHTFWTFGLAIAVIALGILLRVRAYLFSGVLALVWTPLVRSWTYLVEYWWIVLGLVGTGMIVVAVTRELRRSVVSGVKDAMTGWR